MDVLLLLLVVFFLILNVRFTSQQNINVETGNLFKLFEKKVENEMSFFFTIKSYG